MNHEGKGVAFCFKIDRRADEYAALIS